MDSRSIVQSNPTAWAAIHVGHITATHEVATGLTGDITALGGSALVNIAQCALKSIRNAGYTPQPGDKSTRFTGLGITRWQTMLYAVNEVPDWHFPDDVLCVGWLIECGGPSMDRGPAGAQFEDRVKHYVGGTRALYNRGTSGHGGDGFPESRKYSLEECPHVGSHPEPSDDSVPSASSLPPRTSTSTPSQATSNEEEREGDGEYHVAARGILFSMWVVVSTGAFWIASAEGGVLGLIFTLGGIGSFITGASSPGGGSLWRRGRGLCTRRGGRPLNRGGSGLYRLRRGLI